MKRFTQLFIMVLCVVMLIPSFCFAEDRTQRTETVLTENEEIEMAKSTSQSSKPLLVAYYNASQVVSYEFEGIDVLNYHPATINANAMENPSSGSIITHSYSSKMASVRSIAVAQNPDIKFVFTVANNNIQVFESWFYNKNNAEKLVSEMISIITSYGFDGLDIDYEFPTGGNTVKNNFVYFMQRMREEFDDLTAATGREYILSMAVPGTQWAFSLFDMNSLANYVDYFNIMNYDLYINHAYTHHHTPPYDNTQLGFVNGSVYGDIQLYLENGIPAEKIVPGCGLYSRRWENVPDVNNGLYQSGTIDESNIHYTDILARYVNKNGFVRYWDELSQAPYLYNASSGVFLSYDDAQSVEIKCKIVGTEGVRGIMVFDYCTADGVGLYDDMRSWLDTYSTHPCKDGHSYGEWQVYADSTFTTEGEMRRYCSVCGEYESESIAVKPTVTPSALSVEGNIVYLSEASNIAKVIYGKGRYITADSLIASGGVVIEGEALSEYVSDNVFSISLAETGEYTFNVTMSDTRSFVHIAQINELVPTASAEGASVIINNLTEDVNDIFIAKGVYDTYTEVNQNKTVRITQTKIGGADTYTYTLPAGGEHTVLIRYTDGTMKFLYVTIDVTEPVFTENGLQLTVKNLEGIKVIRTAYGDHNTGAKIKAAEGSRAFSAKDVLNGVSEYTIQYRNEGLASVAVCYEDGYTVIYKYDVVQKRPTFVQEGNVVTIGDLEGLKVIRYAKGEYTSSSEIKNAEGSVAVSGKTLTESNLSITLESGTYTFCVQYDDESYNYYTVTV